MNTRRWITASASIATAAFVLFVAPALAHHSSTPFYDPDPEKRVDIEGAVTRFVFRNPHAFLFVDVTDASGETTEWQIELGAPVGLRRVGWTPETLPIGTMVKASGRPSRADGSTGLCCVRMTRADGSPVLEGGRVEDASQNR